MQNRISVVNILFIILFFLCMVKLYYIISTDKYTSVISNNGSYTVVAGNTSGNIYDQNMFPLVNRKYVYKAVINPTVESIAEIRPYIVDIDEEDNKKIFEEKIKNKKPFVCSVSKKTFESEDIYVFSLPIRYSDDDIAIHITGYTSDGVGVCGIEKTYNSVLRGNSKDCTVSFKSDASGSVLKGENVLISNEKVTEGVVTSIDSTIQKICEDVCTDTEKGAVVVMDPKNGDILAIASFPEYKRSEIAQALENENSPLINRALSSYSVGSIFKLVTCAAAYESGIADNFSYDCNGKISIDGSDFHCHDLSGHGLQDIKKALVNSCNPFFIELGGRLDSKLFLQTAQKLGFGREIVLTGDISSSSGTIPSSFDLESSGEKANFSFGQGKLTATPLQVAQFTCAIANNGTMPAARLIKGYTYDGINIESEKQVIEADVLEDETADYLKKLMKSVIYDNKETKAKPVYTTAGAKTSTAQTGIYNQNGIEYNNAWVTGFFPFDDPKYVVTILVEEASSGNDDAAPLFREIADEISREKLINKK